MLTAATVPDLDSSLKTSYRFGTKYGPDKISHFLSFIFWIFVKKFL